MEIGEYQFWKAGGGGWKLLDQSTNAKCGGISRLAYVPVALFWHYTAPKKVR